MVHRSLRQLKSNRTVNASRTFIQSVHACTKAALEQRFIMISLLVASFVWTSWLTALGPVQAFTNLVQYWQMTATMIFGSIVAGGTSMGGGAVAFPVFTKVLQIPPQEAKIFSLAIQSIGMTAASIVIVAMGIKIEWRFIRWVSLGGIPGMVLGSYVLFPMLSSDVIKISFTMMVGSFAVVLLSLNRRTRSRNLVIPRWSNRERLISLVVGVFGGTISGLVGSGMDVLVFSVMVLLFGICEKVGTPTSVILMAINAVIGFMVHLFIIGDFTPPITNYWLAAVPVVVVGAPLGAILCNLLTRKTIITILLGLISIELIASFVLIPLTKPVLYACLLSFALFLSAYYWMYRSSAAWRKYSQPDTLFRHKKDI
ncbi:MAG: sulfite exporter TauE/SafE family protein [Xenococcaceae cyanobacterium]